MKTSHLVLIFATTAIAAPIVGAEGGQLLGEVNYDGSETGDLMVNIAGEDTMPLQMIKSQSHLVEISEDFKQVSVTSEGTIDTSEFRMIADQWFGNADDTVDQSEAEMFIEDWNSDAGPYLGYSFHEEWAGEVSYPHDVIINFNETQEEIEAGEYFVYAYLDINEDGWLTEGDAWAEVCDIEIDPTTDVTFPELDLEVAPLMDTSCIPEIPPKMDSNEETGYFESDGMMLTEEMLVGSVGDSAPKSFDLTWESFFNETTENSEHSFTMSQSVILNNQTWEFPAPSGFEIIGYDWMGYGSDLGLTESTIEISELSDKVVMDLVVGENFGTVTIYFAQPFEEEVVVQSVPGFQGIVAVIALFGAVIILSVVKRLN